jgi:hypothetical protein
MDPANTPFGQSALMLLPFDLTCLRQDCWALEIEFSFCQFDILVLTARPLEHGQASATNIDELAP